MAGMINFGEFSPRITRAKAQSGGTEVCHHTLKLKSMWVGCCGYICSEYRHHRRVYVTTNIRPLHLHMPPVPGRATDQRWSSLIRCAVSVQQNSPPGPQIIDDQSNCPGIV